MCLLLSIVQHIHVVQLHLLKMGFGGAGVELRELSRSKPLDFCEIQKASSEESWLCSNFLYFRKILAAVLLSPIIAAGMLFAALLRSVVILPIVILASHFSHFNLQKTNWVVATGTVSPLVLL